MRGTGYKKNNQREIDENKRGSGIRYGRERGKGETIWEVEEGRERTNGKTVWKERKEKTET